MMSGFSAFAIMSAARSMASRSGNGALAAAWREGEEYLKFSIGAASTSRGRARYTGPFGSLIVEIEGAVDGGLEHLRVLEFVIPFHDLAQHARLVAHFLRPVDFARARAHQAALFAVGRAADVKTTGRLPRHALSTPHMAFAMPTLTCTMTSCGLPVCR